jgi:hypothetical protein
VKEVRALSYGLLLLHLLPLLREEKEGGEVKVKTI